LPLGLSFCHAVKGMLLRKDDFIWCPILLPYSALQHHLTVEHWAFATSVVHMHREHHRSFFSLHFLPPLQLPCYYLHLLFLWIWATSHLCRAIATLGRPALLAGSLINLILFGPDSSGAWPASFGVCSPRRLDILHTRCLCLHPPHCTVKVRLCANVVILSPIGWVLKNRVTSLVSSYRLALASTSHSLAEGGGASAIGMMLYRRFVGGTHLNFEHYFSIAHN
jgi:hypothetical protein